MQRSNPLFSPLFRSSLWKAIANARQFRPPGSRGEKRIAVRHKGRTKIYRINKYGEVFEEK